MSLGVRDAAAGLGAGLLLAVAAAAVTAALHWPTVASPATAAVAPLVAQCQLQMLRGTCSVMAQDAREPVPQRVFVAGLGEVDGSRYAALRQAGNAMCAVVDRDCRADWAGPSCRLARALYPI
jgi:hypothetical protein